MQNLRRLTLVMKEMANMAAKKSVNTTITEQSFPNAEDICKIVVACKGAGVSTLKCGPLEVSFAGLNPAAEPLPLSPHISGPAPTPAGQVPEQIIQAQQQAEIASHIEQEIETREMQVAELMVTNPLLAEQLMEQEELEPAGEFDDGAGASEALD